MTLIIVVTGKTRISNIKIFFPSTMYGAESFSGYEPGGYHPVHLGDKFHGNRYIIVHKLGWGSYSTMTWLARDTAAL